MALLDSAIIHTILWDPGYFDFSEHKSEAWQTCELNTIAGRRDFKFREGRATMVLLRGATLMCENAI